MLYLTRLQGFNAGRGSLCDEAKALIARMTTQPNAERKYLINRTIMALKNAGVWSRLDAFYVTAAHDSQASLLNWTKNEAATNAGGLPFTADVGFVGNGSAVGITMPGTGAYAQTNHALGSYTTAYGGQSLANAAVVQIDGGTHINNWDSGAKIRTRSAGSTDVTPAAAMGHVALSRSNSGGYDVYANSALVAAPALAAGTFNINPALLVDCSNTVTLAAAHLGLSLTASQVAALNAALTSYIAGL
jgi:hypothetical protein